jgi:hypothetical protein
MAIDSLDGVSTDSIIVITDPLTAGSDRGNMGWLRSLPYLTRQGVMRYTFNPSWLRYGSNETFDAVLSESEEANHFSYSAVPDFEFQYRLIERDFDAREIRAQHLCQYTSQETEDEGKQSTTHKLIRAYNDGNIEELVLVVDKAGFRLANQEANKPLTEMHDVSELSYEGMVRYYLKYELPARYLALDSTLNVWLHEAAVEYANVMDSEPNRIADLFQFTELESGIRTWDFFEFLASETTEDNTDHIQATIRPWVEQDITKIRDHILNALQQFDFDAQKVREFRSGGLPD